MSKERPKLTVEIPDSEYWRRLIKCQDACPVHTDARGYVRAIAQGEYEQAFLIARGPNPLASICGRICQAPCEESCRRASVDDPVAIRALKRFATERFGAEAGKNDPASILHSVRSIASENAARDELRLIESGLKSHGQVHVKGRKVAVIGGGPAGLACAHDLALYGFSPVVFEMEAKPAGMLYTGIPEFRLPRKVIDAEVRVVESLGVEIRCNTTVGKDIRFDEIRDKFDATVIAVGAKNSKELGIPGEDATGVFGGVEFLRKCSLGQEVALGKHVVVVGGGFTALDCSRSSVRFGAGDVVTVLYRRTRDEMPVTQYELDEAAEEGVGFEYLVAPLSIEKDNEGKVTGIRLQRNRLGPPDASGRQRPEPVPGSEFVHPCDTVIRAVGQESDMDFIDPERDGLSFNKWGLIDCDEETLAVGAEGVFLAGDAAYGTRLVIDAVASGKKAARSVNHFLSGEKTCPELKQRHEDIENYGRETGYEKISRKEIPAVDKFERITDHTITVEVGFDEPLARQEASRCFDCGVNTIFDGQKCILCGGCADVCPARCLKLVPIRELGLTEVQNETAKQCVGEEWRQGSAIIKDEETCIRCGLCSKRCPTGAITMERMYFSEECS